MYFAKQPQTLDLPLLFTYIYIMSAHHITSGLRDLQEWLPPLSPCRYTQVMEKGGNASDSLLRM